jgi:hypothetical protein
MIKPKSVEKFERLAYLTVAITAISLFENLTPLHNFFAQYPVFYPCAVVTVFAVQILWIRLISRKRKNWARWFTIIALLIALPGQFTEFDARLRLGTAAAIFYYLEYLLWALAVSFLFAKDAREWFAHPKSGPTEFDQISN